MVLTLFWSILSQTSTYPTIVSYTIPFYDIITHYK